MDRLKPREIVLGLAATSASIGLVVGLMPTLLREDGLATSVRTLTSGFAELIRSNEKPVPKQDRKVRFEYRGTDYGVEGNVSKPSGKKEGVCTLTIWGEMGKGTWVVFDDTMINMITAEIPEFLVNFLAANKKYIEKVCTGDKKIPIAIMGVTNIPVPLGRQPPSFYNIKGY